MIAEVIYNDFKGTVAADISDLLGKRYSDDLEGIAQYFNLDIERFQIVGLSLYGIENIYLSLICIDKEKSTDKKEHIVKMSCDIHNEEKILHILFKSLHIVLHNNHDNKYCNLNYDEAVNFSDFHKTKEK